MELVLLPEDSSFSMALAHYRGTGGLICEEGMVCVSESRLASGPFDRGTLGAPLCQCHI